MRDINYSTPVYKQTLPHSEEEVAFFDPQVEGVSESDLCKIDGFAKLNRADRCLMLDIVGQMLREEMQALAKK